MRNNRHSLHEGSIYIKLDTYIPFVVCLICSLKGYVNIRFGHAYKTAFVHYHTQMHVIGETLWVCNKPILTTYIGK